MQQSAEIDLKSSKIVLIQFIFSNSKDFASIYGVCGSPGNNSALQFRSLLIN